MDVDFISNGMCSFVWSDTIPNVGNVCYSTSIHASGKTYPMDSRL